MTKTNKQKNQVKKVPLRKDLVSHEMFDKREMVRVVIDKEGNVSLDKTGKSNGRGAYVKMDKDSVAKLIDKKLLDKEFKTKVPDSIYQEVEEYVNYQISRKELLLNQTVIKTKNS